MVNALTGVGFGPRAYGAWTAYLGPIEVPTPISNSNEKNDPNPLF
jgi:hypothetical protein